MTSLTANDGQIDKLKSIISTLDAGDVSAFRSFIQRQKRKSGRLDLKLFEEMIRHPEQGGGEMMLRFYPNTSKKNRDAYHALRRRLFNHLVDFIAAVDKVEGKRNRAEDFLDFSEYLFDHRSSELAWTYLLKAENAAADSDRYDVLNRIYMAQVERAHLDGAPRLSDIETSRALNRRQMEIEERLQLALAYMRLRIKQIRVDGRDLDPDQVLASVVRDYDLDDIVYEKPAWLFRFVQLVRNALVAKKEFLGLERFLKDNVQGLIRSEETPPFDLSRAQYFVAHAQYRNKRFSEARESLEQSRSAARQCLKRHRDMIRTTQTLLAAAIESFSGHNDMAIEILESAQHRTVFSKATPDRVNLYLNLAVNYFQAGRYEDASRVFGDFPNTDKWCVARMGREWMFKKEIIAMIIKVELKSIDAALSHIRRILKNYEDLFQLDKYRRVPIFLDYVKRWVDDPNAMQSEAVYDAMRADLVDRTHETEDLQAMTYFAWLKSKILGENYYKTLLDMVS